jgi:WD40 repeat protein
VSLGQFSHWTMKMRYPLRPVRLLAGVIIGASVAVGLLWNSSSKPSHLPTTKPKLLWQNAVDPAEKSMISVRFSSDGAALAGGYSKGRMGVWDAITGRLERTIRMPGWASWQFAFSPDQEHLAVSGEMRALLDQRTGKPAQRLEQAGVVSSVSFSPDGKLVAGEGKTVTIWDTSTGRIVYRLGRANDFGADVAFSPDGKTLAYGEHYMDGDGHDVERTCLWDVRQGKTIHTIDGVVGSYAFSPDGRVVAAPVIGAPVVRMWDVVTGRQLGAFVDWRKIGTPCAVDFSPDGKLIAVGGTARPVPPQPLIPGLFNRPIPDGFVGGTVTLSDARTGEILWKQKVSCMDRVVSVDFSPDGKLLAAGVAWDAKVMVWRLNQAAPIPAKSK